MGTIEPLTLVTPEVTDRLVHRITADHPEITRETARRIVGQAAAFIAASGQQPGRSLASSELVDYGWHAFILHTVDYAEFCQRAAGYTVDEDLWPTVSNDWTQYEDHGPGVELLEVRPGGGRGRLPAAGPGRLRRRVLGVRRPVVHRSDAAAVRHP